MGIGSQSNLFCVRVTYNMGGAPKVGWVGVCPPKVCPLLGFIWITVTKVDQLVVLYYKILQSKSPRYKTGAF